MLADVPSPIDLRRMADAREWAESALSKRPWRTEFFAAFAKLIADSSNNKACRVLELGSGPGFLAEHLLAAHPALAYVALDFSAAMHTLAAERLAAYTHRVQFVERNFRDADWANDLGRFDYVVTHQAVHELRHKQYAATLHTQVKKLLHPNGSYLVCDHYHGEDGMSNDALYMRVDEQRTALLNAGFRDISVVMKKNGLVLHHAR